MWLLSRTCRSVDGRKVERTMEVMQPNLTFGRRGFEGGEEHTPVAENGSEGCRDSLNSSNECAQDGEDGGGGTLRVLPGV